MLSRPTRLQSHPAVIRIARYESVTGFHRHGAALVCDGVPLADLAAADGTPLYVYSGATIAARYGPSTRPSPPIRTRSITR